jgi:hypothetical protein
LVLKYKSGPESGPPVAELRISIHALITRWA